MQYKKEKKRIEKNEKVFAPIYAMFLLCFIILLFFSFYFIDVSSSIASIVGTISACRSNGFLFFFWCALTKANIEQWKNTYTQYSFSI